MGVETHLLSCQAFHFLLKSLKVTQGFRFSMIKGQELVPGELPRDSYFSVLPSLIELPEWSLCS